MRLRGHTTAFLFAFLAFFSFIATASAQEQRSAGIKLVPTTIEQLADPGEVIVKDLTVTNVSDEDKEYYLYKRNIKGVDVGGVPVFAQEVDELTGYEISEWISFENERVLVPAGGEVTFPVTITVPEEATPGSHFGGIFVSVEAPKLREIGAGVGYEVASIVSIRISGDIVDAARIRSLSTDKLFYTTKQVNFEARIENQGNILIRPRGPLTITSMFGGDPEVMIVNDKLAGVFPGTMRDFEFSWDDEGVGFGRYEAILALVYDGENGQRTIDASVVFWIFPTKIVLPILGILLLLVLSAYLFTKFYIKRAVARASGGRRIVTHQYGRRPGVSRFAFVLTTLLAVLVLFLLVLFLFFA